MFTDSLSQIIARIPALLIAFAFHEWAHAMVADRFGDPTPRSQGRLSLNPLVHLDPMGALFAVIAGIGWAKPVQTMPHYYRGNKRRADMLVSLAGPAMNMLIGLIVVIGIEFTWHFAGQDAFFNQLMQVLDEIAALNIVIGLFNLIPIPGFDGFHILMDLLPEEAAAGMYRYEHYGMLILLLLLVTGAINYVLMPAYNWVFDLYQTIATALLSLFGAG